jgi:hypothetical protein
VTGRFLGVHRIARRLIARRPQEEINEGSPEPDSKQPERRLGQKRQREERESVRWRSGLGDADRLDLGLDIAGNRRLQALLQRRWRPAIEIEIDIARGLVLRPTKRGEEPLAIRSDLLGGGQARRDLFVVHGHLVWEVLPGGDFRAPIVTIS